MKEGTSAQLSGRGELHGGARVTTLVTLRKCTLGNKRAIKTLKFVSASTKGFKGGLAWIKPSKKDMAVTFSYWTRYGFTSTWRSKASLMRCITARCVRVAAYVCLLTVSSKSSRPATNMPTQGWIRPGKSSIAHMSASAIRQRTLKA